MKSGVINYKPLDGPVLKNGKELVNVYRYLMVTMIVQKKCHHYNIPLCDHHIMIRDGDVYFRLDSPDLRHRLFSVALDELVITYRDDPYMTWAGDYSHLGAYRQMYGFGNVTVCEGPQLVFRCSYNDFRQQNIFPDRGED